MGSKGSDSAVVERRLRPIYDLIDSGNHKKAIHEAERVSKKHPGITCSAKSLKALALVRSGRTGEAWTLIEDVEKQESNEDHTLQALTHCFKDLNCPERIAVLYEGVCRRLPGNEEQLCHLFMAYVRLKDLKKQLKIAKDLYKFTKKELYFFWSVMTTIMQSAEDPGRAGTVYFPLAETMLKKFTKDGNPHSEPEIALTLMVLRGQKKHSAVVELVQSGLVEEHYKSLPGAVRDSVMIEALEALGQWKDVYELASTLLPTRAWDWELYEAVLGSAFAILQTDISGEEKKELIERTTTLVLDMIGWEEERVKDATRAASLARLHWIGGLLERECVLRPELGTYRLGEPIHLLTQYFQSQAKWLTCLSDMKPYLCILGENQQDEFIESICRVSSLPPSLESDGGRQLFANTEEEVELQTCCLQLMRRLGRLGGWETEKKQRVALLCAKGFQDATNFSALTGDYFLLMALHLLWDVYQERADVGVIHEMVVLAERGVRLSPRQLTFKYILAGLYALLGAGKCVLSVTSNMALKHIQKDSMGYLIFDHLGPFGLYQDILEWSRSTESFYYQGGKDAMDILVGAYKHGSFSKVEEIMGFDSMLGYSYFQFAGKMSQIYFSIITSCDSVESLLSHLRTDDFLDPDPEAVNWRNLTDHRDFCHPSWDPEPLEKRAEEDRKESFQELLDIVKFRHLVLTVMGHLGDACERAGKGACLDLYVDRVKSVLSQLKAHYTHCRNNHSQAVAWRLQGPLPTHFNLYLEGGYFEILLCFMECVLCIMRERGDSLIPPQSHPDAKDYSPDRLHSLPSVEDLQGLLRRMVSSHQLGTGTPGESGASCPRFPHLQLCHLSHLVQTAGMALLVAVMAWDLLAGPSLPPLPEPLGKKAKKKQLNAPPPSHNGTTHPQKSALADQCKEVIWVLCQLPGSVGGMLGDLSVLLSGAHLSVLSLPEEEESGLKSEVWNKLKGSYEKSLEEMSVVVKHQEELVATLKARLK